MTAPTVHLIDPTDERWAATLDRVAHDVYVTPAYLGAEALRLDAEPVGCLVDEGDRFFLLPLLVRGVDPGGSARDAVSPYGYPGIVLGGDDDTWPDDFLDDCLTACLDTLRAEDVCSAFVRLHPMLNAALGERPSRHPVTEHGPTVSIDATMPSDKAWALLSRGHANAINKAIKVGYRVEIVPALHRVDELVSVYAETIERLGAADAYRFGDDYFALLAAMEEAFIAVAYIGDAIASAYLFFESHGTVQMHLGGSRSEFRRPSPSHLLIHSVAEWARERGDSNVHLGGGVGAAADDSLFTFKAGFSPRRHAFRTLRLISCNTSYHALVQDRARRLGASAEALLRCGFFPAYRASADHVDEPETRGANVSA